MIIILSEIEAVLSFRPLCFVCNENYELRPITSMHFINFGKSQQTYPFNFSQIKENEIDRSFLLKRKRYLMLL